MGVNGIYGLSGSGLDIESMVKAGMLSKQNKYDKMQKNETRQEWIKKAYADVYTELKAYQDSLSAFKMSSTLKTMGATSNNDSVTCTANANAAIMTHSLKVNEVASAAYLMSAGPIARENGSQTSITLAGSLFKRISRSGNDVTVEMPDGTTATHNVGDVALSFDLNDGENKKTVSFTYGDLAGGKTYTDLASAMKGLGLNVNASYDTGNDMFTMFNKESGADNKIAFSNMNENAAKLLNALNMKQSTTDASGEAILKDIGAFVAGDDKAIAGTNASVTIDGRTYDDLATNYVNVAGVQYTFTQKTDSPVRVNVAQDSGAIVDNVKEFVDGYNKLIDHLNELLDEEEHKDYLPLTDKERGEMSESQVEAWEEKAKSGLLARSDILRKIVSSMREAIYTKVDSIDGKYNSASAIGITTENVKGHLQLDESKLKKALAEDPDCVYQLFANSDDEFDSLPDKDKTSIARKQSYRNTGIANRLYFTSIFDGMKNIKDYAGTSADTDDGTTMGKMITNMKVRMESYKTMMDAFQEQLYKKYDSLEVAIARLSTQLNMITGGQ